MLVAPLYERLAAVVLEQPDLDAGMAFGEGGHEVGGEVEGEGRSDGHGQCGARSPAVCRADVLDRLHGVQDGAGQAYDTGALGGEGRPPAPADQELHAQIAFQGLDGAREGRLGDVDGECRGGDGTAVRDGYQVAQLLQCGGHVRKLALGS